MSGRPITLTAAAAGQAAEGIVAAVFGAFVGWQAVFGDPMDLMSAIGIAVLALGGGAVMLAVARGLWRTERWSRSPTVVTQLLAVPVSVTLIQSEQYAYGVPLVAAAVATLVLVLCPPSSAALLDDLEPAGD